MEPLRDRQTAPRNRGRGESRERCSQNSGGLPDNRVTLHAEISTGLSVRDNYNDYEQTFTSQIYKEEVLANATAPSTVVEFPTESKVGTSHY